GLKSIVVIPEITPFEKIEKLKKLTKVIIKGKNYLESCDFAIKKAKEENLTFLHPFDDPFIIAGQGTVALEILEEIQDLDCVIIPVGGGGLASGTLITIKSLKPEVQVIGVQAEGACSMYKSWKEGRILELSEIKTIAEGIAVSKPGELTFEIIYKFIDDIILVNDEEILEGMRILFGDVKILSELAGSVSVAGLLSGKLKIKNKKVACIISGGNFSEKHIYKILKQS
ncbi:MAG TPA: pyridoxal-phosphate dependent enzyme, partial [bacterium]|nr:pyridoxal-phosphate dependent enzyme [bacterium]